MERQRLRALISVRKCSRASIYTRTHSCMQQDFRTCESRTGAGMRISGRALRCTHGLAETTRGAEPVQGARVLPLGAWKGAGCRRWARVFGDKSKAPGKGEGRRGWGCKTSGAGQSAVNGCKARRVRFAKATKADRHVLFLARLTVVASFWHG